MTSLVGHWTAPGRLFKAVTVARPDDPKAMLPVLHRIWLDTFDGKASRLLATIMSSSWTALSANTRGGTGAVAGVGHRSRAGRFPAAHDIYIAATGKHRYLYLIDAHQEPVIHCYAAGRGGWAFRTTCPLIRV